MSAEDDPLRDAAHQQLADGRTPPHAEHDEPDALLLGDPKQLVGHVGDDRLAHLDIDAGQVRAASAGGATHYLVKPFEYDDLVARLEAFRQSHRALTGSEAPDQDDIDAVFAPVGRPRVALPKGLSPETAALVDAALDEGELSATECAERVGVSRVSARRYLEHFVAAGRAAVRLQYGGGGRPERRYRRTT